MKIICYRPQRSSFHAAMEEMEEHTSIQEIIDTKVPGGKVIHYAFDKRLNTETFLLVDMKERGVGFVWMKEEHHGTYGQDCPETKELPYTGPEWEACKAWFEQHCSSKGYHSTGIDIMDMWFDDLYLAWNAALRWKEKGT